MAIAGITDGKPGKLPVIGDIRKGAEKEQGKAPKDLTYFRFTSTGYPELEDVWLAEYGAEPTEIRVRMPYASVDACLESWYEEYTAGSMVRRCTGEVCVWQRDASTDNRVEREGLACARNAQGKERCGCSPVGRLHVIVPALGMLGTVTVRTGSLNDIRSLYDTLASLADKEHGAGLDIRSIPFTLRRVPRDIPTPGKGDKPVRRTKYLLDLQVAPDAVGPVIRALSAGSIAQITAGSTAALPDNGAELEPEYIDAEPVEEEQEEQDNLARLRALAEQASSATVPAGAWRAAGLEVDPEVSTLGDCTTEQLLAFGKTDPDTDAGREFRERARDMYRYAYARAQHEAG